MTPLRDLLIEVKSFLWTILNATLRKIQYFSVKLRNKENRILFELNSYLKNSSSFSLWPAWLSSRHELPFLSATMNASMTMPNGVSKFIFTYLSDAFKLDMAEANMSMSPLCAGSNTFNKVNFRNVHA